MIWGALVACVAAAMWFLAARGRSIPQASFDETALDGGVDAYLERQEARVPALRESAEKRVVWAEAPEARTDWAVVYVHGFSAAAEEIRPVPDRVAEALGANLHFTRLHGHGRDGPAMGEDTLEAWMRDMAEALAIGRRIGRRVLVLSSSTGGTLVTLALRGGLGAQVAGAVFVAPNFRPANPLAALVAWPGARWWLPRLAGQERAFAPRSEGHARHWTTRYPVRALVPMGEAVRAARSLDPGRIATPALFVFDDRDTIVDHRATRRVAARWGGPVEIHARETAPGDDPARHVIAGDILSPGATDPVARTTADWARGL